MPQFALVATIQSVHLLCEGSSAAKNALSSSSLEDYPAKLEGLQERKHELMQCVEEVYGQAVCTQNSSQRKRNFLAGNVRIAEENMHLATASCAQLDDVIAVLTLQRRQTEVAVKDFSVSLQAALDEISQRVRILWLVTSFFLFLSITLSFFLCLTWGYLTVTASGRRRDSLDGRREEVDVSTQRFGGRGAVASDGAAASSATN